MKTAGGPPDDGDGPDAELDLWAGVLPVVTTFGTPLAGPVLPPGIEPPSHVRERAGRILGGGDPVALEGAGEEAVGEALGDVGTAMR